MILLYESKNEYLVKDKSPRYGAATAQSSATLGRAYENENSVSEDIAP